MGKLSGLNESLAAIMTRPQASCQAETVEPQDAAMLEALNALVGAVNAIEMPEVKIDLNAAMGKLVKAVNGIKFPEAQTIDLAPLVEAVGKIELEVEMPKPMAPCPYTFKVLRDSSGILTGIIATPGLAEEPEHTDTASYE